MNVKFVMLKRKEMKSVSLVVQVVLITGGNGGIGAETTKALLSRGAVVYIACRSAERAEAVRQDIVNELRDIPG